MYETITCDLDITLALEYVFVKPRLEDLWIRRCVFLDIRRNPSLLMRMEKVVT